MQKKETNAVNAQLFRIIGRLSDKEKMALYGYVCGLRGAKYAAASEREKEG